jgi:DNA-directed RNA polymerase subunit RPC12/RpoP
MNGFGHAGSTMAIAADRPRQVIVICEDCGKKYRLDEDRIKAKAVAFNCRVCSHRIVARRLPPALSERPVAEESATAVAGIESADPAGIESTADAAAGRVRGAGAGTGRTGHPLRQAARGLALFLLLPLSVLTAAGFFFWFQTGSLLRGLSQQGTQMVGRLAEDNVAVLSAAAAAQCRLFLLDHPGLPPQEFSRHEALRAVAVQPVGKAGHTALYGRLGEQGGWRIWLHPQPELTGIDVLSLRMDMGEHFSGFWKILTAAGEGRSARGFFLGREPSGKFREKFMACTPVTGTPYMIAATAGVDELLAPAQEMAAHIAELKSDLGWLAGWTLGAPLLLLAGILVAAVRRSETR